MAATDALNELETTLNKWLHIEDSGILHTLAAIKNSHRIPGDPLWLRLIGPSSGGKSEYLRAFTQEGELTIDDLTSNTFVSGYRKTEDDPPDLAERLKNKIWYIYDLSILMSKRAEERAEILSDMRLIYDGRLKKEFGNRKISDIDTSNNTLICASTPAIDNTILEDQILGTRFIDYRIRTKHRKMVMDVIDRNYEHMDEMRKEIKDAVAIWEARISMEEIPEITPHECLNIQTLTNITTLLRTSVSIDRFGEISNLATPEDPGRLYKQLKKLYLSYKMVGIPADTAIKYIRKVCIDSINPIRVALLKWMKDNTIKNQYGIADAFSTTKIHSGTGFGKKAIKSHLGALSMLGLIDFHVKEYERMEVDQWSLRDSNINLLFDGCKVYVGKTLAPIYLKAKYKK